MGSIRKWSGLALLGLGFLLLVFGVAGALFGKDTGPGDWIAGVVSPLVLFLLPGWLLVRSGVKAKERALAEEDSPAAGEEVARSSGSMGKWGGLVMIVIGGFAILPGWVMTASPDQRGAGFALMAVGFLVFALPGWLLTRKGERLLHESKGAERAEAARAEIASLEPAARKDLKGVAGSIGPEDAKALATMLRKGKIPSDPRAAGLACATCGMEGELRKVELTKNTGALIVRYHQTVEGLLCRLCIERIATDFTNHNWLYGWWGPISFLVNLGAIPSNLVHRSAARKLPYPRGSGPPALTPAALERLRPASKAIVELLVAGKDPMVVYRTTAERIGVTPGQVALFAAALAAEGA